MINLVWITPMAERLIVDIARVSNPISQAEGKEPERLIRYMIQNGHWSPFEMASACIEINTTRDIARQILRHRSFSFQEFSQRYADPSVLGDFELREARLQDPVNRQNSIPTDKADLINWWHNTQRYVHSVTEGAYKLALDNGLAKEVARVVLPEGLTPSRLYMAGTIRSWIHYCKLRGQNGTQREHQRIAVDISHLLMKEMPTIFGAILKQDG